MNDVIVWDTKANDNERYTLLYGGFKAFIFGDSAREDHRNITVLSRSEIDIGFMDKHYVRIPVTRLPSDLIEAIKKRG